MPCGGCAKVLKIGHLLRDRSDKGKNNASQRTGKERKQLHVPTVFPDPIHTLVRIPTNDPVPCFYKWQHGFEKQSTAGYLLPLPEEEPLLIWGKPR